MRFTRSLLAGLLIPATAFGFQEAPHPKTSYLTAEEGGEDFAVQGEYSGTVNAGDRSMDVGLQVVARGNGKFVFRAFHGGLPGDGADYEQEIITGTGEREGDIVVLKSDRGTAEISNGILTIYTPDGTKLGELPKVTRASATLGREAPADAVVLFDGTTAENFENGRMSEDKLLMEGVRSKQKFQSFELHMEFRLAFMPYATGQARSNSGCYMQGRYEVQILDSFGLTGESNECGGVYKVSKPAENMCFPPLQWQSYDVEFHAAEFDDTGKKTANAWMKVKHNNIVIHEHLEVPGSTAGSIGGESPDPGPIYLQNHGDPVRFRNIWVRPL